jgi:CHAT domain-containing protein/tetratricopeptide (TPR) repeat protein
MMIELCWRVRFRNVLIMKYPVFRVLFLSLLLSLCCQFTCGIENVNRNIRRPIENLIRYSMQSDSDDVIRRLNVSLQTLLAHELLDSSRQVADSLVHVTGNVKYHNTNVLSDSYYLLGVYFYYVKKFNESIRFLKLCVELKKGKEEYDERLVNALYDLGLASKGLGDFTMHVDYSLQSLELGKKLFGESNPVLINTYTSLIAAYVELQDYEQAIIYSNVALAIDARSPGSVSETALADLYYNLGVCFYRLVDFTKARIYLEKSESIYSKGKPDMTSSYLNLINGLAITYGSLGLTDKSYEYYEKGIDLAKKTHSDEAFNLVNSYALILGKDGKRQKGASLLENALEMARMDPGENSTTYIEVLKNYADYLREFKIDKRKSLLLYEKCIDYLNKNPKDLLLKEPVLTGYALSLSEEGDQKKSLSIIQSLLYEGTGSGHGYSTYDNPELDNIKPDKKSLKILRTKYSILKALQGISPEREILVAISETSELLVSLVEKVRLNIGQEESRLLLGDHYRDSYFNAIHDLNALFTETGDRQYLENAFMYSEKSKVAGLLASTREIKASYLNIPTGLSEMEKKLQRDMNLLNERINEKEFSNNPDTVMLGKWKENLLETTRKRDSLVRVFEKDYPGYYSIKYNTNVAGFKDIPGIVGRNCNYVNYLVSDTVLYVFIANRKNLKLLTLPVDSVFFNKIKQFRSLLAMPGPTDNARILFRNYQVTGNYLVNILVNPARKYLISDRIIISPDNILSYLPFETLPASQSKGESIKFREIDYLLNEFDISYAYSATFMAESANGSFKSGTGNSTIAFAPEYTETVDIRDLTSRQKSASYILADLPYARQEAEYVAQITGGKLFEGTEAKESVFKSEACNYDIIHLAMHTVVNDREPMQSTLIFSKDSSSAGFGDRYLQTYEIYGIPLKAKMVVLSSCNTGSGLLYSGEGIMSLARGFIHSGSESVVMSMWEIDDRSGTDIVKMFYKNLKRGYTKSKALREARIDFLKTADQYRSHPYFWSALVIYGDNAPLYKSGKLMLGAGSASVAIVLALILYLRKRRYS